MEAYSILLAFCLGFISIIMVIAVLLAYKLYEFMKNTVKELMDEIKKL